MPWLCPRKKCVYSTFLSNFNNIAAKVQMSMFLESAVPRSRTFFENKFVTFFVDFVRSLVNTLSHSLFEYVALWSELGREWHMQTHLFQRADVDEAGEKFYSACRLHWSDWGDLCCLMCVHTLFVSGKCMYNYWREHVRISKGMRSWFPLTALSFLYFVWAEGK